VAQRISIEDGAFFKGGIDIRKAECERQTQAAEAIRSGSDKSAVRAG